SSDISDRIKMLMDEARNNVSFDEDSQSSASNTGGGGSFKTFGFVGMKISSGPSADNANVNGASSVPSGEISNENSNNSLNFVSDQTAKRKRLAISDVFNAEEDEMSVQNGKKRRPP